MRERDLLCRVGRRRMKTTDLRHRSPKYPYLIKGLVIRMAMARMRPGSGVMHQADQGVQYVSDDYVGGLKGHGFEISMARIGDPCENAGMKGFFAVL